MTDTNDRAKTMMRQAIERARSQDPTQLEALFRDLTSPAFLDALDSAEDYDTAASQRLRVSRVVEALARNADPTAQATFVALLDNATFITEEERIDILIMSSAFVIGVDARLAVFWDRYSQPDDGYTPLTITAMLDQGASDAIQLFEAKLLDAVHDDDEKIGWLRTNVIPHRDDSLILDAVLRLVQGNVLSEDLRVHLVEVIFDYRPEKWFRPATVEKPPNRAEAADAARQRLVSIGEFVIQESTFPASLQVVVREVVEEQRAILRLR